MELLSMTPIDIWRIQKIQKQNDLLLQGLEGKLFTPVALTIVFALSGALVMSLSIIPVLGSLLMQKDSDQQPWLARILPKLYQPILVWALANTRIVYISSEKIASLTNNPFSVSR